MTLRSPAELADSAGQQQLLKRLKVEARRWVLRSILFGVMAVISLRRGGSFFVTLGVTFVALAGLGVALSRQNRRGARDLAAKLALLEQASPHHPPPTTHHP